MTNKIDNWGTAGAYHLAANPSAYQPVRTSNFRLLVPGLKKLLYVGEVDMYTPDNSDEIIDFSVVKFDVPHFKQDPLEVSRGNSTIYFAGKAKYQHGNLIINDFAGADGKSILEAWQALSYDPINDTIPSSNVYKMDATLVEYLPDNTLNRYWTLEGCWVKGLSETGFDNESASKKQVTAEICYDRAIPHKDTVYTEA